MRKLAFSLGFSIIFSACGDVRTRPRFGSSNGVQDASSSSQADTTLPKIPDRSWADVRVRAIISQMTLDEKIAQLQHNAPAIERLNLPSYYYWNEALHGVLTDGATSFPQAIALASTWDTALLREVASVISDEARGFNNVQGRGLTYWSPVINMLRDPRWGRYEESYSEDPFLMARLGVAFVQGLQGNDPKYIKAVATPKHYVANNSEFNRHNGSSEVDEQLLHEYYLPAFEATVREAGAFSVMSAYNRVNGIPASASTLLLQTILRDTWGFQGYVVSDCDAVFDIFDGHHWVSSLAEASARALLAGTDLNCGDTYPKHLHEALDKRLVAETDIDRALFRILRARFLLGEFDPPSEVPYAHLGKSNIESNAHSQLALKAAQEAIVLLKNDGILPLSRSKIRNIAIIGPHGDDVMLGGYSGRPSHSVSALQGVRAKFANSPEVTISFSRGSSISGLKDQSAIDAAAELASKSDVALVFVGTDLGVFSEERDRPDWALPGAQGDLISAVFAANPRTIVVLVTGGPVAVDYAKSRVPAILASFYNGQEQGTAIADVIFGDINPAGKLTTTWYTGDTVLPPIGDYDIRKGRTYLYFTGLTLFPFGHGLSYTTFSYSNMSIQSNIRGTSGVASLSFDITNSGLRSGVEVVQLYIQDSFANVPRPLKQLRGFKRIALDPGERQTVKFDLNASDLAFWDVNTHGWRVEPGVFNWALGSSSIDIRLQGVLIVE